MFVIDDFFDDDELKYADSKELWFPRGRKNFQALYLNDADTKKENFIINILSKIPIDTTECSFVEYWCLVKSTEVSSLIWHVDINDTDWKVYDNLEPFYHLILYPKDSPVVGGNFHYSEIGDWDNKDKDLMLNTKIERIDCRIDDFNIRNSGIITYKRNRIIGIELSVLHAIGLIEKGFRYSFMLTLFKER